MDRRSVLVIKRKGLKCLLLAWTLWGRTGDQWTLLESGFTSWDTCRSRR
jgi:hypothetical protein